MPRALIYGTVILVVATIYAVSSGATPERFHGPLGIAFGIGGILFMSGLFQLPDALAPKQKP